MLKNGFRRMRFHDLRHSCASLLLANGVPLKQIQDWLGHSSFKITADAYAYSIQFRVNPRKAIRGPEGPLGPIGLFLSTEENVAKLYQILDICIESLGLYKQIRYHDGRVVTISKSLRDFRLVRLDYCINCTFQSRHFLDAVLSIMKKSLNPTGKTKHLQLGTYYDQRQRRELPYKHAIRLDGQSYAIQIYDKEEQMLDNINYFKTVPDAAEGLLRFELAVKEDKIRRMKKRYATEDTSDRAFLSMAQKVGHSEMCRYMDDLFGKGDYLNLQAATIYLQRLSHQNRLLKYSAGEMTILMREIAVSKGIGIDFFSIHHSKADLHGLFHRFNEIGLNPYPLPDRKSRILGPMMPSIATLLTSHEIINNPVSSTE